MGIVVTAHEKRPRLVSSFDPCRPGAAQSGSGTGLDQHYEGRNKDRPNDEDIEHDAHRERNCICNGADSNTAGCAPARLSIFERERGKGRLSTWFFRIRRSPVRAGQVSFGVKHYGAGPTDLLRRTGRKRGRS